MEKEEPKVGMVPFEEKLFFEGTIARKGIFIDGELFDWGISEDEYNLAVAYANKKKNKDEILARIHRDIEKHYLSSLSEFIGRKITLKELQEARKTGWIKK